MSLVLVVGGALVALAVPRGRPVRAVVSPTRGPGSTVGPASAHDLAAARTAGRGRRRGRPGLGDDLASTLHDVAARVRSGAVPRTAWSAVLGVPVLADVPTVGQLLAGAGRPGPGAAGRAAAAVAAGRLAAELGAPLADVLEQVAQAVAADEEHETEVAAALAGPRATTRVLTLLPVAGALLGMALGAHPLGVVLDGGLGTASAALGVVLLLLGRAWTGRLTARTARAGRLGPVS